MDVQLLRSRLNDYLAILDSYGRGDRLTDEQEGELFRAMPTVFRILHACGLDAPPVIRGVSFQARYAQRALVQQALGILNDAAEIDRAIGPQGPELHAVGLHPWVWDAAAPHWDSGQYRTAVATAAGNLSLKVQAKLDRWDVADDDLMTQSLNPAPPKPTQPRLRIPATPGRPFETALQEGTMSFARGVFSILRNPATHRVDEEWLEQRALEALAALSLLARALDEATVERADEDAGPD